MFGKIFESLFTGSMIGAGSPVFAVWSYVIANQKPDKRHGSVVELNPKLLSAVIGDKQAVIEDAIKYLCSPDPDSRTREKDGRRLVKLGQFDYQVVNGEKYRQIRNQEERRAQNRVAQQKHRSKGKPLPGESEYVKLVEMHGPERADEIWAEREAAKNPSSAGPNLG